MLGQAGGTLRLAGAGGNQRIAIPIAAFLWGVTGSGVAVSAAVRSDWLAEKLNAGLAWLPLLSHPVGLWDLEEPVAHRLEDGALSPLSVLGCVAADAAAQCRLVTADPQRHSRFRRRG